jgi:hypothetical protein
MPGQALDPLKHTRSEAGRSESVYIAVPHTPGTVIICKECAETEAAVGRGGARDPSRERPSSSFGVALVDRPNWPISRRQRFTS